MPGRWIKRSCYTGIYSEAFEKFEIEENTIERQCNAESFESIKDQAASRDAILSMACGIGVQMAANIFVDKPIYPALNTMFYGTNDGAGQWSENCPACGDCKLGIFDGVCPVMRCSKSLLNGPCSGSAAWLHIRFQLLQESFNPLRMSGIEMGGFSRIGLYILKQCNHDSSLAHPLSSLTVLI